jgi:PilZ domain-containing protein
MATQDIMTKTSGNSPISRSASQAERRGSRRCKINQLMRIRPSDPEKEHFEDLRGTTSVSRGGVFFQTSEMGYELGMRLFVTMPYSRDPGAINREYLAEVVRLTPLPNGLTGIGIKLLMEMGMQHSYSFTPPSPSRRS